MRETKSVLVIDEDPIMRAYMQDFLSLEGYAVQVAENDGAAPSEVQNGYHDCVLVGTAGSPREEDRLAEELEEVQPGSTVLMIIRNGNGKLKVKPVKLRTYDYFTRLFGLNRTLGKVKKAVRQAASATQDYYLR